MESELKPGEMSVVFPDRARCVFEQDRNGGVRYTYTMVGGTTIAAGREKTFERAYDCVQNIRSLYSTDRDVVRQAADEANACWDRMVEVIRNLTLSERARCYNYMSSMKWDKNLLQLIWSDLE